MNEENKYPRTLVISNNSFSKHNNNGKTLASFFKNYPKENVFQLYFSNEIPDNTEFNNFYRVTEIDIINSMLKNQNRCGMTIKAKQKPNHFGTPFIGFGFLKNINFIRYCRELIWKTDRWKNKNLKDWLNEIKPEVIMFCAGDSEFAYDVTDYILDETKSRLFLYMTDDYILPRKTISPFWWIRRQALLKKMKKMLQKSDQFLTISEKMQKEYEVIFSKNSQVIMNMTKSLNQKNEEVKKGDNVNKEVSLVYTGGLHFNRWRTLVSLGQAIQRYNETHNEKMFLRIYSHQKINTKLLKVLNVQNVSSFLGGINSLELEKVLNTSDILVHVESFEKKSIESTRLSISTKIPEYLSVGKPVLAIGPESIASMEYLHDTAYCITNPDEIYSELDILINNDNLLKELSERALEKYEQNHQRYLGFEILVNKSLNNSKGGK
ncbi:hypothetical protein EVJ24_01335 [Exiguobacterium sp. SH1S21]|uniref:hypothetical protein n=1 Tax=Exiguobacterium sp. SH1S21 TaxID=2510953 RepID=UPI00103E8180|nr:hypothetical protein [Exiguobacterium sp. SH1S21]TCI57449.1 hypothetical protein EVJ24_01335 [Exiguobacterium sp. SH1S21]